MQRLLLGILPLLMTACSTIKTIDYKSEFIDTPVQSAMFTQDDKSLYLLTSLYDYEFSSQKYGGLRLIAKPNSITDEHDWANDPQSVQQLHEFVKAMPMRYIYDINIFTDIDTYAKKDIDGHIVFYLLPNTPIDPALKKKYLFTENVVCLGVKYDSSSTEKQYEDCPDVPASSKRKNKYEYYLHEKGLKQLLKYKPDIKDGEKITFTAFKATGRLLNLANRDTIIAKYPMQKPLTVKSYVKTHPETSRRQTPKEALEDLSMVFVVPFFLLTSEPISW